MPPKVVIEESASDSSNLSSNERLYTATCSQKENNQANRQSRAAPDAWRVELWGVHTVQLSSAHEESISVARLKSQLQAKAHH